MASIIYADIATFPNGTALGIYGDTAVEPGLQRPPQEPALSTQTMTNGSATFTGLADDTNYWVGAQISGKWRYVGVATLPTEAVVEAGNVVTCVNVKDYGATGDGLTDDTTAIQTAINSSVDGDSIFFPAGTYLISAAIVMKGNRSYVGEGWAKASGATIKQKDAANITNTGATALFVPESWNTNAATCDYPVHVHNLHFDGNLAANPSSNASGVILYNFWSRITDCYFTDMPAHGIHLTDLAKNQTTTLTNSASENTISNCKISDTGGCGIYQYCNTNADANLDGHVVDCYISGTTDEAIKFDRAAGWSFRRIHSYGANADAIVLECCFATIISECYIEDFGEANVASAYYSGIKVTILNGRPVHVVNNTISCNEPVVNSSTYIYVDVVAKNGQDKARSVVTGNHISGAGTATGYGYSYSHDSGGVHYGVLKGNIAVSVNTPYYFDAQTYRLATDNNNRIGTAGVTPLSNQPTVSSGTGSPESVVTAMIGSLYLRLDGGASTTLYVKTSGSGNTGWTAK